MMFQANSSYEPIYKTPTLVNIYCNLMLKHSFVNQLLVRKTPHGAFKWMSCKILTENIGGVRDGGGGHLTLTVSSALVHTDWNYFWVQKRLMLARLSTVCLVRLADCCIYNLLIVCVRLHVCSGKRNETRTSN